MEERAATPFILSLLSGLFIVAGTIMGILFWTPYSGYYPSPPGLPYLVSSGVCGILILLAAFFLYSRPQLHVAWGVMILVLSIGSMFGLFTGYYALFGGLGALFGLIGGATSISWRPYGTPLIHPGNAVRMCHVCGRYVPMSFAFCIYCGAPAPTMPPSNAGAGTPPPSPPRP